MSFITGTSTELIYASVAAGTAKASFTSEVAINDTAGMGPIAHIPPDFWAFNNNGIGRGLRVTARGIVASTATPSYTFTLRLGSAASTSAAIILGSAALPTSSGLTTTMWEFRGEFVMKTIGAVGANSTGVGTGLLLCTGFTGTPPCFPLWGGAATPGTVSTVDTSITNYLNFNITCTASSPSNTITLQSLLVEGLN
jgi:hypothetical protein